MAIPAPCRLWAERVRGRVGRSGGGSFAVWTKRTPSALALVVGAFHSLGRGALAPEGTAVLEGLAPPLQDGVLRLQLPRADGSASPLERAVAFHLFHPPVPAGENVFPYVSLRPEHDFYVDVMDGQRFPVDELLEPLPEPLQQGLPVPLHDPNGLASGSPTFASPAAGALVAYVGFPKKGPLAADGAIGFGAVLSTADATSALAALTAAGDEEGVIAYDPAAEMMIAGEGFDGMSGGGVFDETGRLAGILVRASAKPGSNYVRAVRLSAIAAALSAARARLPAGASASVAPFLPTP